VKTQTGFYLVGDGGVCDVVPLLEASFWRHILGELSVPHAVLLWCCCCSGLSFQGAMYTVAGNFKEVPFSGLAKSCHPPADS
jgi:hypothetical protein